MPEEKIIQKLVEHDERLERLETKVDGLGGKVDNLTDAVDKVLVIVQRLD